MDDDKAFQAFDVNQEQASFYSLLSHTRTKHLGRLIYVLFGQRKTQSANSQAFAAFGFNWLRSEQMDSFSNVKLINNNNKIKQTATHSLTFQKQ